MIIFCIGVFIARRRCRELTRCVFDKDIVNERAPKLAKANGIIVGSPVYYGNPNGTVHNINSKIFAFRVYRLLRISNRL